jgi:hypothetical protein
MLSFHVFVYTEPRSAILTWSGSAKLQPSLIPLPAVAGKSRSLISSYSPSPSFNSFIFNSFRTLSHNGRLQFLSFQSLADSFHCNGGVYPPSFTQSVLREGPPPSRTGEFRPGWTDFFLSPVTSHQLAPPAPALSGSFLGHGLSPPYHCAKAATVPEWF